MADFYLCTFGGCNRKYKTPKKWIVHMTNSHNLKDQILPTPVSISKQKKGVKGQKQSHSNKKRLDDQEANRMVEEAAERRRMAYEADALAKQAFFEREKEMAVRRAQIDLEMKERDLLIMQRVLEDGDECVICYDRPKDSSAVPCGHAHFCFVCLTNEKESHSRRGFPVCRQSIEHVLKIHV